MLLSEILKSKVPYEVVSATPDLFTTRAVIGDRFVTFSGLHYDRGDYWEVLFHEKNMTKKVTFDATGSGKEFDVGSFVIASLQEFVDRYKPNMIEYTTDSDTPTRSRLYKKAFLKALPDYMLTFENDHLTRFMRKDYAAD